MAFLYMNILLIEDLMPPNYSEALVLMIWCIFPEVFVSFPVNFRSCLLTSERVSSVIIAGDSVKKRVGLTRQQ